MIRLAPSGPLRATSRRRCSVLAPRPPSVAAGRGGTTSHVSHTRDFRPYRLVVAVARRHNAQASASTASSTKPSTRTGSGTTTPGTPTLCARSRQHRAIAVVMLGQQFGPVAVGQRAQHVHVLAHPEQRRAQRHRGRAVSDDDGRPDVGQIGERGARPDGDLLARLAATAADVASGQPVGELVRVALGDLVAGQALPVPEPALAQPRLGDDVQAAHLADGLGGLHRALGVGADEHVADAAPRPAPRPRRPARGRSRPTAGRPAPGSGPARSTRSCRDAAERPGGPSLGCCSDAVGGERDERAVLPQLLEAVEHAFLGCAGRARRCPCSRAGPTGRRDGPRGEWA